MKLRFIPLYVLFVSACSVGPDYERPEMGLPDSFSAEKHLVLSSATSPDERPDYCRWWENFGDPSLNELIEEGIKANPDAQLAEARVRESRALYRANYSLLFPSLETTGSATRSKTSKNANSSNQSQVVDTSSGGTNVPASNSGEDKNLFQAGFDASWEIDIWGGSRRRIEVARETYEAQLESQRDVLVTLLSEIAQNYIHLRGVQHQLKILERNLETEKETVEIERLKLDAGVTNDLTVSQAEAQLASVAAQAPTLDTQMHAAIHRLSVLLNQAPGALEDRLLEPKLLPEKHPAIPTGLPSELILRRPDVRQAERNLAAATANIGVATAELFPKLNLTGSLGLRSEELSAFTENNSVYYSFGSLISWPIFELRPILFNIQIQEMRAEQAALNYRKAVLQSLEDVNNALIAHDRELSRNALLNDAVQASGRALARARELNEAGIVEFLNVLTAQQALFLAETQLAISDQATQTTLVAVYKALGGGWESELPREGAN